MGIPTPDPAWDQTCRANEWIGRIVNRGQRCELPGYPDQPGLIESIGAKRAKELCREVGE